MASMAVISTTIDDIVQRTNEVKVCQDHLKLIATRLIRLQHGLSDTEATKYDSRSQEDIIQILKAIEEVLTSCSENESDLNVMTYRELESLLLRFQWRLAQHETNMTDDYEMKIRLLSDAYQEQHILMQKPFDETIKQRLDAIEQSTKERTTEQLGLLREKHSGTIESYLRSCTELHKGVPLTGLTDDTIAKVAHTFYRISFEQQNQLEVNWQTFQLPLIRMPIVGRDRYSKEENVSEENIIRTKRWIVILGDPGSGKTSFARWLVCHLAQTLLLNGQNSTDYGPLRIPILIHIREFAEILNEQPLLTLFDYIGRSIIDHSSTSIDNISVALQDYIRHGQALIILDGLDEISVSDQRLKIINIVENFVDSYVQIPSGASVFDNPQLSRLFDDPSRSGGNQLIVTSRIVGYHAAPLPGRFAHYTIQPMDIEHIKQFVDSWFFRVHQYILDTLHLSVLNQGKMHGEALKNELEKTENVGLLQVASNSSLLSSICSISFSQRNESALPTPRILLYEKIVNSILSSWNRKRSIIPIPKLIRMLSDIASYIHEYSPLNFITEEEIKDLCIQSIKPSVSKSLLTEEDIQDIEIQASKFSRIILEDLGFLTTRSDSCYGFLHLIFQEYFTCLKFIDTGKSKQKKFTTDEFDRENEIQSLSRHTNDQRFRVSIALALGKVSSTWCRKDFDNFCSKFIQKEDESDSLLPLGAYTLITSSHDLVNYPSDDIVFDALDRLMIAAGQHKWSIVCPFLFDRISIALKRFRNNTVSLWINKFLSRSPSYDIQTISAVCHLLEGKPHEFENIQWLSQSSCLLLQSMSTLDNEFAIDRLLIKVAFSNHQLLPSNPTTLKAFLLGEEIDLNSIPVILLPLIITLYGGLKRDDRTITFDPSRIHRESTVITPILIRFLALRDPAKQDQGLKKLKQELIKSFLTRIEKHDESYETVDLCIATICLYDIEYVQDNWTIISNSLLRKTTNRLKYISMILRQFYFTSDENDRSSENETTKFISIAIQKFQYGESARVQFIDLLNSLRSSTARLRSSTVSNLLEGKSKPDQRVTLYLPNTLRKEDKLLNGLLSTDTRLYSDRNSCSLLHRFTNLFWLSEHNDDFSTQYRMAVAMDSIPTYLVLHNDQDLLCSLTFVPGHLQNLYLRLLKQKLIIISSKDLTRNDRNHLYFGHILTECLMLLSNTLCKRLSILIALIVLLPWLRMQQLDIFGSSLFWALGIKESDNLAAIELNRQRPMNDETGEYMDTNENIFDGDNITNEQQGALIKYYIEQEHQRLENALTENDGGSIKLYSASVSLAHVCRWTEDERRLSLLQKSIQGAMSINNKLARLDALCVIAIYSDSDYNQIQISSGKSLQEEIECQLNAIYPTLPLLLHATIFIRCLPLLQHQQLIDNCLENLFGKFADNDQRDQQAVNEALLPYMQSNDTFSSITKYFSYSNNRVRHNKSSVLKKYFNIVTDASLSSSVLISNLYLAELTSDLYKCMNHQFTIDELIALKPFRFESSILTEAHALAITNVLSFAASSDQLKLCTILNNALHRVHFVEFKARHVLESWMKWKNSNEFSSFACHAALLLANSDLWSVEVATLACDLLSCENDRFRQRAEVIFRFSSDNDIRTSSKLGIDVLLILVKKKAQYQVTSASTKLTLYRMLCNIYLDIQSHLEIFLWLERYRIHALGNKEYSLNKSRSWANSYIASYFSPDIMIGACSCINIFRLSGDLITYMCDMIACNLFSFLEIDGDTTSNAVLESHAQFVVSVVTSLCNLLNNTNETRQIAIEALMNLFEISNNNDIRRAVAYTLGYVCNEITYKTLFEKIRIVVNSDISEDSNHVLGALISSYSYCVSVNKIAFDQNDMDLFLSLLNHLSQDIVKAVRTGFGRVLKDQSFLFGMLNSDPIQCYHALIDSTAYLFLYDVQQNSENAAAEFIEEYPSLLSIFIIELYNSIRHYTNRLLPIRDKDFDLAYGYPQYVKIANLIAVRMPVKFCNFIRDWHDGENLKRALFYTSKQHNFPQRAACLAILSLFGELTVELCEMFTEALRDDPYIQNTCYKCLTRINTIKDEKVVLNLLFSYLKSKSMNVRYFATKILLHLVKSSLISFKQVRTVLNDLMLDSSSNEDLWLIEEQDTISIECGYYYAGPLKDVIYSLLVQYLTGDTIGNVRRQELNDVDSDFNESEKASRLASCLYEAKTEENVETERPIDIIDDDEEESLSSDFS